MIAAARMAYYDALIAKWQTLAAGSTAAKLAQVNALTVAGPNRDVPVAAVESYLSLRGLLTAIEDWLATSPAPGFARIAAKELLRTIASPHVETFVMSDATVYATIHGLLESLVADPPALITSQNVADLMALAATTVPWWQSAGYTSSVSQSDLDAAGGIS